jgi:uncharacterized membrane protein
MTLAPLLDASTAIQAHAFAAMAAFALGAVQQDVSLVNLMRSLLPAHSADLGGAASPLTGMVPMYVLMSGVHLAPWLKLISHRRSAAHRS